MTIKNIELLKLGKQLTRIKNVANIPNEIIDPVIVYIKKMNTRRPEDIVRSQDGLNKEDEFLLLALLVASTESIIPLDGKQYVNQDKYTIPDFLASVKIPKSISRSEGKLAQRFFIEVKKASAGSMEFFLPEKEYIKLRNFATLYSLPLYFAIKFDANAALKHWCLIPGKVIEARSIKKEKKIKGQFQKCYSLEIGEAIKEDCSGLWLDNFTIVLNKGTIITKEFDRSATATLLSEEQYGGLIKHTIKNAECEYIVNLQSSDSKKEETEEQLKNIIRSTLLKKLARGQMQVIENGSKTITSYEADENYFISYYSIIMGSFLHLRPQFGKILGDQDDSISYYVDVFSENDLKLSGWLKSIFDELIDKKVVLAVRMMPNIIMPKKMKSISINPKFD